MKTKMIVTLIIMSSMLMTCSAETGTLVIEDVFDGNIVNTTVNYNATVDNYLYVTKYSGDYDIEGFVTIDGKTYNAEFDGSGLIYMSNEKVARLNIRVDGKLYQKSEVGFLYAEDNNDYFGYIENGYNTSGSIYFYKSDDPSQGEDIILLNGFALDGYSKCVITAIIPQEIELTSSESNLGLENSAMGDIIPTAFVYKDPDTKRRVVSETYPTDHTGPVIIMPARIVGEPLFPNDFWTTPKGVSIIEKKANNPNRK